MKLYPLPNPIYFQDYDGNWTNYQKKLHGIFLGTILNKLTFLGLPVRCRYFQPINKKHRSFWHLISEGSKNDEERIPDLRRCERLPWISHMIKNSHNKEIKCWENNRNKNTNTILWLPPESYMVILSKRKDHYLLLTAYVHKKFKIKSNTKESEVFTDPRKAEAAAATSNVPSTLEVDESFSF